MTAYEIFTQTQCERVSDGVFVSLIEGSASQRERLILVLPQLGDFDSLEYAWWLKRESKRLQERGLLVQAVGIGNRASGQQFCNYTGFPADCLFVVPNNQLHAQLNLYSGLSLQLPGFSKAQNAWFNLILMCAGVGSPGTLAEVFRGYRGDRKAPQLIENSEVVQAKPLPTFKGSFFKLAGGEGFQRPFELATLRLKNMVEVLSHWKTYVPDAAYLVQRGGTFLFDAKGNLIYEHRDRGILGFAANMSDPLSFL